MVSGSAKQLWRRSRTIKRVHSSHGSTWLTMSQLIKRFLICFLASSFLANCAGPSIFQPIPLNANPPVLAQPIFFAFDEAAARGYLINSNNTVIFSDASLLVLDMTNPAAPSVINAISLDNFSGQAFLDTSNKKLYVANRFSENSTDNIDQIFRINVDEGSPNFLGLEQFDADSNPFGVTSDGTDLFVANDQSLDFYQISDLTHRTRVDFNIQIAGTTTTVNTTNTREVALSPSGQLLYVSNRSDKMLILNRSEIPLPDPTLELTLGGSEAVNYVLSDTTSTRGVASDSNFTYVVEGSPPSLKILSNTSLPPVTGSPQQLLISSLEVAEVPLGNDPSEIALDTVNHRAYVTNNQDNNVSVIDTNSFVEVVRIPLNTNLPSGVASGEGPFGISVAHFGGIPFIYALNLTTNNVSIINGNTLSVVATFP
jgi:DNA-binding beta-propeller fold protein YncE